MIRQHVFCWNGSRSGTVALSPGPQDAALKDRLEQAARLCDTQSALPVYFQYPLDGGMVVGRKYIGKLDSALKKYVSDQLKDRTDIVLDRAFITHTCPDRALPEEIAEFVLKLQPFRELHITRASCTIGSHCGPNTLGVLFLRK